MITTMFRRRADDEIENEMKNAAASELPEDYSWARAHVITGQMGGLFYCSECKCYDWCILLDAEKVQVGQA